MNTTKTIEIINTPDFELFIKVLDESVLNYKRFTDSNSGNEIILFDKSYSWKKKSADDIVHYQLYLTLKLWNHPYWIDIRNKYNIK